MARHRGSRGRFGRALGVAAVVAVLAVVGTSCEPAPPPGTSHSPSGYLDSIRVETRRDGVVCDAGNESSPSPTYKVAVIEGWASDWDTLGTRITKAMFYVIPPRDSRTTARAFWYDFASEADERFLSALAPVTRLTADRAPT